MKLLSPPQCLDMNRLFFALCVCAAQSTRKKNVQVTLKKTSKASLWTVFIGTIFKVNSASHECIK